MADASRLERQVPVQLPIQLRITPDRDTVIWLDGFRRWRGAISFETHALTSRPDLRLAFVPGDRDADLVDVVARVDGRERRASRADIVEVGNGGPGGSVRAHWTLPVPDDVSEVTIRLESESLPLRRILELDAVLLGNALGDVWELD